MLDKDFKLSGINIKNLRLKNPCIKKVLPVDIAPGDKVVNPYYEAHRADHIGHTCYDREINAANIKEIKEMYEAKIQIDGNDIGKFHTKFYFNYGPSGFRENNVVHSCRENMRHYSWTKNLGENNNLNIFYKLVKVNADTYQLQRCDENGGLWNNKYYDIDTKYVNFSDCAGINNSNIAYFEKYYKDNQHSAGPDFIIKMAEAKIVDNYTGHDPIISLVRPVEVYEYSSSDPIKAGNFVGQLSTDYGAFYLSYKNEEDLLRQSPTEKIIFKYKGQNLSKSKMDIEIIKEARDKCNLGEFTKNGDEGYTFFLAEYDENCAENGYNSGNSSARLTSGAYSTTFTSPYIIDALNSQGLYKATRSSKESLQEALTEKEE